MQNDLKTAGNRPKKSLITKLRNQFRNISLTPEAKSVLQTSISAAC